MMIAGLLWPRFSLLFKLHMESLQNLHTKPEVSSSFSLLFLFLFVSFLFSLIPTTPSSSSSSSSFFFPLFLFLFFFFSSLSNTFSPSQILGDRSDVRPHFIIRRYGEFVCGVRVIGLSYQDGRLATVLSGILSSLYILYPYNLCGI